MSGSKRKSSFDGWTTAARRVRITVRFLLFRAEGRLTLVGVAILALLTVGPYLAWRFVGDRVAAGADYQLTADRVELVPKPESVAWIHRDLRGEALRDAGLESGGSISDDDLCERLAKALALHPWIAHVGKVTKHYPARVEAEVVYRKPVAVVALAADAWWPVDASGVVLPRDDFTPNEARGYPRIADIAGGPHGPTGAPWGDVRVVGAARIAEALAADWRSLALDRVSPLVIGTGDEGDEDYGFVVHTLGGVRVYWGHGPENSSLGEPTTEDKVKRLREFARKHGSLDAGAASQDLDLRHADGPRPIPRTAEKPATTSSPR